MWFKNILVYRLNRDLALSADDLERQLAPLAYHPCGSQDMMKTGWVSPMKGSDALTHAAGNQILICAKKKKKCCLPVIKQELQEKIEKLEADQGRKLKKQKKILLKMRLSMPYYQEHSANTIKPTFGLIPSIN